MPFPRGRNQLDMGGFWLKSRKSQYLLSRPSTGTGGDKRNVEKGYVCVHKFNSFHTQFEMKSLSNWKFWTRSLERPELEYKMWILLLFSLNTLNSLTLSTETRMISKISHFSLKLFNRFHYLIQKSQLFNNKS